MEQLRIFPQVRSTRAKMKENNNNKIHLEHKLVLLERRREDFEEIVESRAPSLLDAHKAHARRVQNHERVQTRGHCPKHRLQNYLTHQTEIQL